MKSLIFLFLILLTFQVNASLSNIQEQEVKKILSLFEDLIYEHDFSYVIFGSKPMALADICLWVPDIPIHRRIHSTLNLIQTKERLKAWYKYKDEFNLKDFILLDKEEDLFECLVFVLIHKARMLSHLHLYENIFTEILGNSFTPESFLEKIEKREVSLANAINHNHGLLGIMLGYGVRNSLLFQEKRVLFKEIEKRKWILSKESELYKKFQKIHSQLQPFNEFEEFSIIMPLHFAADISHPETIELREKYKNDQQKIAKLMRKPKFINRALIRLME